jgi:predicted RecB family nuclease
MDEQLQLDYLLKGLRPALYEKLAVMNITTCEELIEKAKLHADVLRF